MVRWFEEEEKRNGRSLDGVDVGVGVGVGVDVDVDAVIRSDLKRVDEFVAKASLGQADTQSNETQPAFVRLECVPTRET